MKKALLLLLCCFACNIGILLAVPPASDEQFQKWEEAFVPELWAQYPAWASSVGYHKYDDVLVVPDEQSRIKELAFCRKHLTSLRKFDVKSLSPSNQTDYHLIENQLESTIWSINELRQYEWDPSSYNVCGGFAEMLANDYEPLPTRVQNFSKRLTYVPAYYATARKNIKNPTVVHTELAIEQHMGALSVFNEDIDEAMANTKIPPAEKLELRKRADSAIRAIKDYMSWLTELDNKTPHSFRLGKEHYQKKFAFDMQSGYTAETIYNKAIAHKKELHEKMYALTLKLWPKHMAGLPMPENHLVAIRQLIDTLSLAHVAADSFQLAIEQQLPKLIEFIKAKNLIYIDPTKPLVVRGEPAYMAGVAGASINSPGPYDKNGNTYYNVGSLDEWSPEKAESYLREYNKYILQILNIHEAIPGHYTQLVYANQSPSIIKAILGNNAMIEGWAVYAERMMLENGYDGEKGPSSTEASPEMWLMYYKWNMRSTCNTILDYSVHTMGMSKEAAMSLLMTEAFQQEAEAEGKWKRVSLTQVQLCCYFTGYTEIYDLREGLKKKSGASFNLKEFHEQFLSFGSAPVKYIRELMLH